MVPIASGAFIGLITAKVDRSTSGPLLIAAGVVGALVTFGLYLYEAWQADDCRHLIHHASFLEQELHMEAGQFRTLRSKIRIPKMYPFKAYEPREQCFRHFEQKGAPPEQYMTRLEWKGAPPCDAESPRPLGSKDNEPKETKEKPHEADEKLKWTVGAELAGLLVYGAVFVAWLAVAGFGVAALFVN